MSRVRSQSLVIYKILVTSAAALILGDLFAGSMSVDEAKRARGGVPIYNVAGLSKTLDQHSGELVGVICNCRSKDIRQLKPNWYESSILSQNPHNKRDSADLRVVISKADLEAFKAIPIEPGRDSVILQGRVEHDSRSSFLHLVARNVRADATAHP